MIQRSKERIISDIVESILLGRNIRTHIMYKCNLSYSQLEYYIDFMIKKRLVERFNGESDIMDKTVIKYGVTQKGYEYSIKYSQLLELVK